MRSADRNAQGGRHRQRGGGALGLQHLCETKIDDLHEAVRRDLNVHGFQVAVDDTLGGCFQCVGDLSGYPQRVVNGNRTAGDGVGERVAFNEFEHDAGQAFLFLAPIDRRNVGMIECREELCFALESRQPLNVLREWLRQDFDRHFAPQVRVAPTIHLSHAATAQR